MIKLWIGTNVNGIGMFDGKNWKVYNMRNMNLNVNVGNIIKETAYDRRGNVYASHGQSLKNGYTGGITRFNGDIWEVLKLNVVPSEWVESFYIDKNDNIWVGTKEGMTKFYDNPSNAVFYNTYNSQIPGKDIRGVVIDNNENV